MKACIYRILFFTFALSTAFTGCITPQQAEKKAADVSERFFKHLKNQEYDKARALGTEKTGRIITLVQTLSEMGGGINLLRDNKKELLRCEIDGHCAVCTYKAFSGPEEQVFLVKEKGKWRVELKGDSDP